MEACSISIYVSPDLGLGEAREAEAAIEKVLSAKLKKYGVVQSAAGVPRIQVDVTAALPAGTASRHDVAGVSVVLMEEVLVTRQAVKTWAAVWKEAVVVDTEDRSLEEATTEAVAAAAERLLQGPVDK